LHALEACVIRGLWGVWQPYEKTSTVSSAVVVVAASGATSLVSHPSVVRFVGHLQLKGLAPRTVEAYVCMIRLLAQWAGGDPALLSEERVRDYFLHLVNGRSYAPKTLRQARAALSCFFIEMLGVSDWRVFAHIKTKDSQKLPVVLSREEVRRVLVQVKELRFLAPLTLIYLCGLRLSEALNIETRDIHRKELRLHVRLGKGGKDRYVPLPQAALDILERWYRCHHHACLLFPAMGHAWKTTFRDDPTAQAAVQKERLQQAAHPMSDSALQNVWRLAFAASGVTKKATIHTLRHSYATHLLEEGVSLRYVSQYLGHATLQQTLVYAHLTDVSVEQTQRALARLAATLTAASSPAPTQAMA
jgi:site-specific recombinase XerD